MKKIINILLSNQDQNLQDNREIYEYGLFVLLFNILSILSCLIAGFILKESTFSIQLMLVYLPIRMLLGGYHCKTPTRCYICFVSSFSLLIFLHQHILLDNLSIFLFGITLICIIHNYLQTRNSVVFGLLICLLLFDIMLSGCRLKEAILFSLLYIITLYILKFLCE